MSYVLAYVGLIVLRFSHVRDLYRPVLLALFLFAAFRFEIGCDWTGYRNQFEVFAGATWDEIVSHREPLWALILVQMNAFGIAYPWLNVLAAAIFFAGIHLFARRQPDPLGVLVLLYPVLILNMPMSGIRQGAAIGVIALAFLAFVARRPLLFAALVLIAAGLHSSAAFFLLLIPFVQGDFSRNRLLVSGLLAVPGGLALMTGESVLLAASRYLGTGVDASGAVFRVAALGLTAVFWWVALRRIWAEHAPQDLKLVTLCVLMMAALPALLPVSTVIADRLGYYLIPVQAMIFARLPFLPLRRHPRLLVLAPYLGLLIMLATWTSVSRHFELCYQPYRSWLAGPPETTPP